MPTTTLGNGPQKPLKKGHYRETLYIGFQILDDIFLSKPEQAKFLGYELEAEEDLEEIKEHLRNYMNADAMVRLTMLIDIKVKLDAVFSNHKELEIWMDAKHESLDQRSFKTLIASGDVGNLVLVLSFLTRMTG